MRYKTLIFIILFFVALLATMEFNKNVEAQILSFGDKIRIFFISNYQGFIDAYKRHFEQAKEIEILKEKVKDYEKISLENLALKNDNASLRALANITDLSNKPFIYLSLMTSYVRMGEYKRIWLTLDSEAKQKLQATQADPASNFSPKLLGLVKNGKVLGIARYENGRLQGFLNGSEECSYGVFIGDSKALGILDSSQKTQNKHLVNVNYIPKWVNIKVGDVVYTNGLDGIFIANIAVGEVVAIYEDYNYLRAEIKPYAQNEESGYMWAIDISQINQDSH
ncbi:rod shape-determining protein MreC [Helicobacter himalayensis]|uniref:rod shape-determining protein MreC n=1 Tax=Helicobacter himalayensis TaxID=1591088 RepID=UPI000831B532|nr:rod shape-determining protein MreC [Helicobacter himalayensis]